MPDGLGEYIVVRSHEETEGEYVEMEWSSSGKRLRSASASPPRLRSRATRCSRHRFVTSPRFRGLKRPSTAIAMAVAWHEHRDLLVPTNPVMRAAVALLAPIGRLRGYR